MDHRLLTIVCCAALVEGDPALSSGREPCARKAFFGIGGTTRVEWRTGAPADTGALTVGRRVSVWISGWILQSCPPQAGATTVVIEDPPAP